MPHDRDRTTASAPTALLGPTNTGKTHRAIERMLEFESGMMGLPLRLLAREVYDRVSARIGEQAVALITGEEKRVPERPRYWICTVEAMPLDLQVDFVAIDEIQLVGHPERGHVFTDRMLHARGRAETWLLGSGAVEGLLREQLDGLRLLKLPRLSQLRYTGQSSLRTLPRRSAVVAFSMPQVYELADALRRRRGGAAVVLGALSPRVRNAQVALYQAGEVDFLVATDAIGMGLNLDVDHVALAGRVKFDGFEVRELESAELAQIVGRAGRYLRDGTFGTLAPEPELSSGLVQQLEAHRFPAQRFAYYRNSALDFASVDALLTSLTERAPRPGLRAAPEADDVRVLRVLKARPELAARGPEEVRALWEVCAIPNYEKRIPEHQAERVAPFYLQLRETGRIASAYVDEQLKKLERYDGDIHALMDRLAAVRTFTYVSQRGDWLEHASAFRARTRALEDKLGDVLHERLLERFVDPGERRRGRGHRPRDVHHPFARLFELGAREPDAAEAQKHWVERLIAAPFAELSLAASGELSFEGERVARLERGPTLLRPGLKLLLGELDAGSRARIDRRLVAHTRDLLSWLFEPLVLAETSAPLRGLAYQLEQGLGTVLRSAAREQLEALSAGERAQLAEQQIVIGKHSVYAAPLLATGRLRLREALCRAYYGAALASEALFQRIGGGDRGLLPLLGFVALRSWALRCDVLEVLSALSPEAALAEAKLLLGANAEDASELVRELPRTKKKRRRRTRSPSSE